VLGSTAQPGRAGEASAALFGRRRSLPGAPAVAGLVLVLAAALAGCEAPAASGTNSTVDRGAEASVPPPPRPAVVTVTPADGARGRAGGPPGRRVGPAARHGALGEVTGPRGTPVAGSADATRTTWTSSARLAYGTRYTARAVTVDGTGKESVTTSTFTTIAPRVLVKTSISPLTGTEVGVSACRSW
jgi:hypothetical protein